MSIPNFPPHTRITVRPHAPGDLGWVIRQHALTYIVGLGWAPTFEAAVARIAADFIDGQDSGGGRERGWIAERVGSTGEHGVKIGEREIVGSVFLIKDPEREGVANLRLLVVHPSARKCGIGKRLVDACVGFARKAGYLTLSLWTHDESVARYMYEPVGFKLVLKTTNDKFVPNLPVQQWELSLADDPSESTSEIGTAQ